MKFIIPFMILLLAGCNSAPSVDPSQLPPGVWVDNSALTGGDGSFESPFDSLSVALEKGDVVHILVGDGYAKGLGGALELREGQKIYGHGLPRIESEIKLSNSNTVEGCHVSRIVGEGCASGTLRDNVLEHDDSIQLSDITGSWNLGNNRRAGKDTSKETLFWIVFGFCAQGLFTARFIVQWLASEKAGKSVVPKAFWYLSLGGSLGLLTYATHRWDPVFMLGQSTGSFIYIRNLFLLRREAQALGQHDELEDSEEPTSSDDS